MRSFCGPARKTELDEAFKGMPADITLVAIEVRSEDGNERWVLGPCRMEADQAPKRDEQIFSPDLPKDTKWIVRAIAVKPPAGAPLVIKRAGV